VQQSIKAANDSPFQSPQDVFRRPRGFGHEFPEASRGRECAA
jgi:hypothetical protein